MSEEHDNAPPQPEPGAALAELMELFKDLGYWQRLKLMCSGLAQPKGTGAYRRARTELQRQWAPLAAIAIPSLVVLAMVLLADSGSLRERAFETAIIDPEEVKKLERIEEPEPPRDEVRPHNVNFTPELALSIPAPAADALRSPQPQPIDAVLPIRSPVILRNILGATRAAGTRGQHLQDGGGNMETEGAVLRALRWLKKYQRADGSWWGNAGGYSGANSQYPEALTALALLALLGHGETPTSEEFGDSVRRGILWLLGRQRPDGQFTQTGGGMGYTHPIVTYALCEAFAMTLVPSVREAAERSLDFMLKGQNRDGGWDYHCVLSERSDVSICAWCVQSLKAAKLSGLSDPERLDKAMQEARRAFNTLLFVPQEGVFRYHNQPSYVGQFKPLTAAAVLSLQFMGYANDATAQKGLAWINRNATCDWREPWGDSPIYYWYYTTQVKFQAGGKEWTAWNGQFAPTLVRNQIVVRGGADDGLDIGYWEAPRLQGYDGFSYLYNTVMCALQLEVYYRYLPTFKEVSSAPEVAATAVDSDDIKVEVDL